VANQQPDRSGSYQNPTSATDGAEGSTGSRRRSTWRRVFLMLGALLVGLTAQLPITVHATSTTPLLLGEQQWYKLLPHRLTDQSDLAVNVTSGNLVVHASELSILGTGLRLVLDRYYNSEDTATGLFNTWRLSTGKDVSLSIGTSVTFTGPSGFQSVFTPIGGGQYTSPAGINAKLQQAGVGPCSGFAYTLTFNKSNESYCFDSSGTFQKDADRNGDAISFGYTSGKLTSITDTQGRVVNVSYGSTGSIQRLTDSTGRFTAHQYKTTGQLNNFTDANGKQTTYDYNAGGQLDNITDALGHQTKFTYSVDGRHIATITYVTDNVHGTGPTWQYTYNSNETTVTDPNGHQTQYSYDSSGRVTSVIDANGHNQATTYTMNDDAQLLTDGITQITTLAYDTNNNLTSIQAPASAPGQTAAMSSAVYSAPGQTFLPSAVSDPLGNCSAVTYDTAGNIANVYDSQASPCSGMTGGAHYSNAYQGDGTTTCGAKTGELCTSTDPKGNVVSYSYDSHGNLTKVTPPTPLGTTIVVPDALSRSQKVTDGKAQLTTYTFDSVDRITQVLYAGTTTCNTASTCLKYTYDADGNLTQRVDNTGTTNFYYDALNRLTTKTLPATGTACAGSSPLGITFGYDGADNLISYCDSGGTITYSFDPANNLTGLAEPTGSCTAPVSLCTTFGYDNNNRRTKTIFPGEAEFDIGYDLAGNETSAIGKDMSGNVLTSFSYTYNQGTKDTALRQTMVEADPQGNSTSTYSYDSSKRLTKAATSPGTTLNYAYDADGNRCSTSTTCDGSYTYNAANELTASPGVSSYSYDANGNETGNSAGASFSYNAKDQSTAITDNSSTLSPLTYADAGQTERTAAGSTTLSNSPSGVQISTNMNGTSYYTRDDKGNLIGERLFNGLHWYYLEDGVGSIVGVIGATGVATGDRYHYDPFGRVTLNTGVVDNVWGFAGGYTDSTGLLKFGARYYDPSLGRWTQQDPFAGSIQNPATVNRYVYAGGDPINASDPTGRSFDFLGYLASSFVGFGLGTEVYIGGGFLLTTALAPAFLGFLAFGFVGATIFAGLTYELSNVTGF
jgi:RHS repeat-associated protein